MDRMEKAQRLMKKGVNARDVGDPKVRRIMMNYGRENYRQQVAQATALNPSGLPQNLPIQPAPQGFNPTGTQQPRNYTWSDGDTVQSVSSQFNMTPNQLLDANPDMQTPQTGMVINTRPGVFLQDAWWLLTQLGPQASGHYTTPQKSDFELLIDKFPGIFK